MKKLMNELAMTGGVLVVLFLVWREAFNALVTAAKLYPLYAIGIFAVYLVIMRITDKKADEYFDNL